MGERFADHENGGTLRRSHFGARRSYGFPSQDAAKASQTQLHPWTRDAMLVS
jgi:hypothetical protein